MAKMYRTTVPNLGKNLGYSSNPQLVGSVRPLEGDQTPGGYLQKIKVSIIQANEESGRRSAFMIYACTNDTFNGGADIITAQAVGSLGGTVWLSLKRSIKSYTEEVDRGDGPVYIYAQACDPGLISDVEAHLVLESWGRYVMLGAH